MGSTRSLDHSNNKSYWTWNNVWISLNLYTILLTQLTLDCKIISKLSSQMAFFRQYLWTLYSCQSYVKQLEIHLFQWISLSLHILRSYQRPHSFSKAIIVCTTVKENVPKNGVCRNRTENSHSLNPSKTIHSNKKICKLLLQQY